MVSALIEPQKPQEPGENAHLAAELCRLSTGSMEVVNLRDWEYETDLGREVEETLYPTADTVTVTAMRQDMKGGELNAILMERCIEKPDYYIDVMETSADIDLEKGLASVFMKYHVLEEKNGAVMHALNEFKWKLVEKKGEGKKRWMCYHVISMRGLAADSNFYE